MYPQRIVHGLRNAESYWGPTKNFFFIEHSLYHQLLGKCLTLDDLSQVFGVWNVQVGTELDKKLSKLTLGKLRSFDNRFSYLLNENRYVSPDTVHNNHHVDHMLRATIDDYIEEFILHREYTEMRMDSQNRDNDQSTKDVSLYYDIVSNPRGDVFVVIKPGFISLVTENKTDLIQVVLNCLRLYKLSGNPLDEYLSRLYLRLRLSDDHFNVIRAFYS